MADSRSSGSDRGNRPYKDSAPSSSSEDCRNPFIAFRRYADSQISSFLQSFVGLPSVITPSPQGRWIIFDDMALAKQYLDDKERQQEGMNKWGASGYPPSKDSEKQQQDGETTGPPKKWFSALGLGHDGKEKMRSQEQKQFQERVGQDDSSVFWGPRPCNECQRKICHPHPIQDRFWVEFSPSSPADTFLKLLPFTFGEPYYAGSLWSSRLDSPAWAIPYILFSPYSPIALERMYSKDRLWDFFPRYFPNIKWREPFEDLLRLENQGEMVARRKFNSNDVRENARDWIAGMVDRGSLGHGWRSVRDRHNGNFTFLRIRDEQYQREQEELEEQDYQYDLATMLPENDRIEDVVPHADDDYLETEYDFLDPELMEAMEAEEQEEMENAEEAATELELYEHLLGLKPKPQQSPSPAQDSSTSTQSPSQPPSILSTLTTTSRETLPDGSVRTKVVLKKRFADGREESSESVHIVNGHQGQERPSPTKTEDTKPLAGETEKGKKKEDNKKKSGWYWSG